MECGGTQLGQCLNLQQRGRPPLPGGRDGLARSFVHCSTRHFRKERGSKRLAVGNPGAIGSRCDAGLLRGTYERCRGESTDQTTINVVTDEVLTFGLKSWSRGRKSQAASAVCSGGVSAVMGTSDLDEHTLVRGGAPGNQLSCSLPSGAN